MKLFIELLTFPRAAILANRMWGGLAKPAPIPAVQHYMYMQIVPKEKRPHDVHIPKSG